MQANAHLLSASEGRRWCIRAASIVQMERHTRAAVQHADRLRTPGHRLCIRGLQTAERGCVYATRF
jgi:hypothetical protein